MQLGSPVTFSQQTAGAKGNSLSGLICVLLLSCRLSFPLMVYDFFPYFPLYPYQHDTCVWQDVCLRAVCALKWLCFCIIPPILDSTLYSISSCLHALINFMFMFFILFFQAPNSHSLENVKVLPQKQ